MKKCSVGFVLLLFVLVGTGCKKKDEGAKAGEAPAAPSAGAPATPPAAKAPSGEFTISALPAMGLPECDALNAQITSYNACAKIKDDDRVVGKMNVEQLPAIVDLWKNEKDASQKDVMKGAAVAQCKDTASKLDAALKASGC